ncbi:Hypothetical predicted protein [Paramuricea clavata]|uniref:Uncharacterized protein n=1 Tax=Paramuricea clavata TaxID=317549 RepID=A0A6S7FFW8_PARCT|nr:Hypothetical predicted protein [Paramuricea clavata]
MAEITNEENLNLTEITSEENLNLTGYSDTDDDDDEMENVENVDQPEASQSENVELSENIHAGDVEGNQDIQICGSDDDDDGQLDEQVIQGFLRHLVQLQEQVVKKKKENRLIPCVSNFLKLDFDQKSQQISPTIIRHLLHVCELIVRDKLDIKIDHGDRGVLEHITSKDCPKKDIKFTLVEDMRIHSYIRKAVRQLEAIKQNHSHKNGGRNELLNTAKRSSEEAGLIESRQEVKKSVKNNSSTAGNDIINFLRKTDSYRKSVGLDQPVNDDDDGANAPVPVTAGVSGAGHKAGTVAASAHKIEQHLQKHDVKPIANGIKMGDTELNISYEDMMEDLTRNYTQTQPNLTPNNRRRVLILLKRTGMPVSYVRNKKMKEEYKQLLSVSKPSASASPSTLIPTPQTSKGKSKSKGRRYRSYLSA